MSFVTAEELIHTAQREFDFEPSWPMATVFLGERIVQLGEALQVVGRRDLDLEAQALEVSKARDAQTYKDAMRRPTLGAVRHVEEVVDHGSLI